jgi:hypothetical protein
LQSKTKQPRTPCSACRWIEESPLGLQREARLWRENITLRELCAASQLSEGCELTSSSSNFREETGENLVTDGEQRISSFATYPIIDTLGGGGLADNLKPDGERVA